MYHECGFELSCWESGKNGIFDDYGNFVFPFTVEEECVIGPDIRLWGCHDGKEIDKWIARYDFEKLCPRN
jgi:hypothetical protein